MKENQKMNERQPLVSVIVPVYNASRYLERALSSLERQTYHQIEVIIINDGSTDDSEKICQSYAERDKRFRYFYQSNCGVSAARNAALRVARGEYIAFMDSDDWVEPDYVETMLRLIETTSSDIAVVSWFGWEHKGDENVLRIFKQNNALKEMYCGKLFDGVVCGKMYRRALLADEGFPQEIAFFEDMVFAARAICNAKQVVFQPVPKYHYTYNPASATKAKWNPKVWTSMEAAKMLYQIMEKRAPTLVAYGGKVACYTNLVIAQKLVSCDELDKNNYWRVKNEILKYFNREVKKVLDLRLKVELIVFLKSRSLYIVCRKLFKSELIMRLRQIGGTKRET